MVRDPNSLLGNAADECDCLATVDRWLTTGDDVGIEAAFLQQAWPSDARADCLAHWTKLTSRLPPHKLVARGHGWRAWYPDESTIDSTTADWITIPDGIVLVVSYHGHDRWMAQGLDPFWLTADGLVHDSRTHYPDGHTNPRWCLPDTPVEKQGVWVSDEQMRRIRWLATLSFTL